MKKSASEIFRQDKVYEIVFKLSPAVYESFQICSSDKNPLHTDDFFAKSKGFPERVMYGNILNAFISYFVGECLETKHVIIQSQNINFRYPVFLNDELEFMAIVDNISEAVNTVEFKFTFSKTTNAIKVATGKISIQVLV